MTTGVETEHHVIASRYAFYLTADMFHYPGPFMAKHHGQRDRQITVGNFHIGMTNPDTVQFDDHFVGLGRIESQSLELEWCIELTQNGGGDGNGHDDGASGE